jgi:hypothetical protein
MFCIFFVGIFCAWQIYGQIPDVDAPLPPAGSKAEAEEARITKLLRERQLALLLSRNPNPLPEELHRAKTTKPDRNLRRHYANILELTVAIRTLGSRFLSPNDVLRGRDFMSRAFQSWARMGAHMTPYFHLAVHYVEPFLAMGPSYGWWTFPYERNNGFLGRFNHNGHGGGELEATMMRGWWKSMLIYNLVRSPLHTCLTHRSDQHIRSSISSACLRHVFGKIRLHLMPFEHASRTRTVNKLEELYEPTSLKWLQSIT